MSELGASFRQSMDQAVRKRPGAGHWGHKARPGQKGGSVPGHGGDPKGRFDRGKYNGHDAETFHRFVAENFDPKAAREIRQAIVNGTAWCGMYHPTTIPQGMERRQIGMALGLNLPEGHKQQGYKFAPKPNYWIRQRPVFLGQFLGL